MAADLMTCKIAPSMFGMDYPPGDNYGSRNHRMLVDHALEGATMLSWPEGALDNVSFGSALPGPGPPGGMGQHDMRKYAVQTPPAPLPSYSSLPNMLPMPEQASADDMNIDELVADLLGASMPPSSGLGQGTSSIPPGHGNSGGQMSTGNGGQFSIGAMRDMEQSNLAIMLNGLDLVTPTRPGAISNPPSYGDFVPRDAQQPMNAHGRGVTPFERGSVRRATVTMGSLRNMRPSSAPYNHSRGPSLHSSTTASPVSSMHMTRSTPFVPTLSVPGGHEVDPQLQAMLRQPEPLPGPAILPESESEMYYQQYRLRPDSLHRRNTINLGQYDLLSERRRRFNQGLALGTPPETAELITPGVTAVYPQPPPMPAPVAAVTDPGLYNPNVPASMLGYSGSNPGMSDMPVGTPMMDCMSPAEVPPNTSMVDSGGSGAFTTLAAAIAKLRNKKGPKIDREDDALMMGTPPGLYGPDSADDLQNKQPRKRRTFAELNRNFVCPVPECARPYASAHSLQQHIRIKHVDVYQAQKEAAALRDRERAAEKAHSGKKDKDKSFLTDSDGLGNGKGKPRRAGLVSLIDQDLLSKLRLGRKSGGGASASIGEDAPITSPPAPTPPDRRPCPGRSPGQNTFCDDPILEEMPGT